MKTYKYQMFFGLNRFCLGRTTGKENNHGKNWEYFNHHTLRWDIWASDCWEEDFQYLLKLARKNIPNFSFSFSNHTYQ